MVISEFFLMIGFHTMFECFSAIPQNARGFSFADFSWSNDWFFQRQFDLFKHHISFAGIAAFAVTIGIGILISTLIQHEKFRKRLTRFGLDKNLVAFATSAIGLMVLLCAVVLGLNFGGLPVHWETPIPGVGISVGRLVRLVIMLVAIFWAVSALKRFLFNRYLSRIGIDRALQYAIAQICGYVALVIGVFIILQNVGINLSSLAIFVGALGVGIGVGLQNVTSNFISGLIVLLERPIKIGDRVEVDKVAGRITAIHARSTTVLTNDNINIIVPNSHFIEKPVTNWTHGDLNVRFLVPIRAAYGSDVEKVCELLLAVAKENPATLENPAPTVIFEEFGEYALKFQLSVWSAAMSSRPRSFRSDLNFAIERKFREAGIEIPVPQRDIYVKRVPSELASETQKKDRG